MSMFEKPSIDSSINERLKFVTYTSVVLENEIRNIYLLIDNTVNSWLIGGWCPN